MYSKVYYFNNLIQGGFQLAFQLHQYFESVCVLYLIFQLKNKNKNEGCLFKCYFKNEICKI